MKATDLRIRNLVWWKDPETGDLMEDFLDAEDIGLFDSDASYASKHLPIPITPELLERAGFKINTPVSSREYIKDESIKMVDHYDKWLYIQSNWESGIFIEYIHQLQNLYFALTEKELEIK